MMKVVNQAEYNAFVQQVQDVAAAFGLENRVRAQHLDDGRIDGYFEVFWECWRLLGSETNAMTPSTQRTIDSDRWEELEPRIAYEFAKG